MKNLNFFLIFFLISSNLFSQTWEKDIPDIGYFWYKCMTNTKDTGCLISGCIMKGEGKSDAFLLKCDKNRDVEWFKTYGTINDEAFDRPIQTFNSDYVILGRGDATYHYYSDGSYSTFFKNILVRINQQGNLLWSVSLPNYSQAIIELPDSSLLVAGRSDSWRLTLTCISSSGNINWTKMYETPDNGSIIDMVLSPQKKIFILTQAYGGIIGLMNVNLTGTVNWYKTYFSGASYDIYKYFLFATSDGGALFTGGSFINVDSTGNIKWENRYYTGYFSYQMAVETKDGGFVCSSVMDNGSNYTEQWNSVFFKLDASGNLKWSNLLGANTIFNIAENETGYNIEGGYQDKIYFAQTDSLGNTGCELQRNYPIIKQTMNYSVSTQPVTVQNITLNDSTTPLIQNSYSLEFENVCCKYKPSIRLNTDGYPDVCDGENLLLTATGGPTILWNTGENNDSIYVEPHGQSSYWVECQNTCGYIRDTIEINPKAPPSFTINFAEQIQCFNDTIKLLIKGNADNYYSLTGDLIKLNDSIYYYFPDTLESIVIGGYKNYYQSVSCRTFDTLIVNTAFFLPEIQISDGVLFSNYLNGNQWYFNGNEITGANSDSLRPLVSGNYQVKVTIDTCSAFSGNYNLMALQISNIMFDKFTIYPTPANEKLYISISQKSKNDYDIWIYDIAGKPVLFQKLKDENEISTTSLEAGIYFYKIIVDNIPAKTGKFIIIK